MLQNELNSDVARFTTHIKPVLQQIRLLWSNRSFNIPLPRVTPWAFDVFENYCSNSPLTRAKMTFKCPTLGSIQVIKCPHPENISQAQK